MNGRALALASVASVAIAGLVTRRGSRASAPIYDALLEVVEREPEDVALWTLEVWTTAFRTDRPGTATSYLNDAWHRYGVAARRANVIELRGQSWNTATTGWEQYREDMVQVGKDLRTIAAEELEKGHWLVPIAPSGSVPLLDGVVREVRRILALPRSAPPSTVPPRDGMRQNRNPRPRQPSQEDDLRALARALPGLVAWAEEHALELGTTRTFTQAAYAAQRFVPARRASVAVAELLTLQTWKEILKWQDYLDSLALLERHPDSDPVPRPPLSDEAEVLRDYLTEVGAAELPSTHWLSLDTWTKTLPSGERNPLIKQWIRSIDPGYTIRYGHRRGLVSEFLHRRDGWKADRSMNRELLALLRLVLGGVE